MSDKTASEQIDDIIALYAGWKGDMLQRLRAIVVGADDGITEEVKWKMASRPNGWPVWSCGGIVCFAEVWKDNVKLLFPKGAALADANGLFNARLQSADIRAIELREGDDINGSSLRALVADAVRHNKQ